MKDRLQHSLALEFHRARLGAMRASVDELIRNRPPSLLADCEGCPRQQSLARHHSGIKSVPIYRIISRSARYDDFTQRFSPDGQSWQPRRGEERSGDQPPIELYHVGGAFFVKDGHRRVTEARTRGQLFLLARVTEYLSDTAYDDFQDLMAQLLRDEYHEFELATGLTQLRPAQLLVCTSLGGYTELLNAIETYRADVESGLGGASERLPIALGWYDTHYLPIAAAIRRQGLLKAFPGRSEADLYLWAASRSLYQETPVFGGEVRRAERVEAILQVIASLC